MPSGRPVKGRTKPLDLSAITGSVEAKEAANDLPDQADFAARLDRLELAIEQVGKSAIYVDNFNEYCDALRRDQSALTYIRWGAVAAAAAMIILLLGGLTYFMIGRGVLFWMIGDTAKAAIIVSVIGGSIAILIVVLRGSFRTIAERNKDDVIPEHLKALYETVRSAAGRD